MNTRFAEYATSGAFAVGLSRAQVASLSLVCGVGGGLYTASASLERKGLVEPIRDGASHAFAGQEDRLEFRLTRAGALVLELCRMAGLTNVGGDAVGAEIDGLRRDLDDARGKLKDAVVRARSMEARLEESERELEAARDELVGRIPPRPPMIRLRDPLPHLTTAQVMEGVP